MKRTLSLLALLLPLICIANLPFLVISSEVQVTFPECAINLNNRLVDNSTRQYPLITYNDITYFPMTYDDCRFLGLNAAYSAEAGLVITKVGGEGSYGVATIAPRSRLVDTARVAAFPVVVNSSPIVNSNEEYPLLVYKDITYFPLTWRFAVTEFGWAYSYSDASGLSITSSIKPTDIRLSKQSITLEVSGTEFLSAILSPVKAQSEHITWTTNDHRIAMVSSFGQVLGMAVGRTIVTATTANGLQASCAVDIINPKILASNITLSPENVSIEVGKTVSLSPTVLPVNADDKSVSWSSSNTRVATIGSNGLVSGISAGEVTITARTANGRSASGKVTVTEKSRFIVPKIGNEYGPFTVATYYSSNRYWYSVQVSSFVVTKVERAYDGMYKMHTSLQGVSDSSSAIIEVVFFGANDRVLGEITLNPRVSANRSFNVLEESYVEMDILDNAMRMEFYSYSGEAAKQGLHNPDAVRAESIESIKVPVLDQEYGPFTVVSYFSPGRYWDSSQFDSFVFTKIEPSSDNYRVNYSASGISDSDSYASVVVRFFDANNRAIGDKSLYLNSAINQRFNIAAFTFIGKDILDNAVRMEFFSYSGEKALPGIVSAASLKSR